MNPRDLLLTLSIPIQDVMSMIHPPYAQTTVADAEAAMLIMRDGDILLSREAWHFTNYFIPGFWSHAAIYGQGKVIEAIKPAVQIVDFRDWVIEKHNWIVLRPICPAEQGELAFNNAIKEIDKEYDDIFKPGNNKWYCSELSRDSYFHLYLPVSLTSKKTIVPEDFYKSALCGELKVIKEHRDK